MFVSSPEGWEGIQSDYHEAFKLAAISAVPLWLSSLVLLRGVKNILKVEEGLIAFDIAYTVTGLGLIAWVALVMLGLFRLSPDRFRYTECLTVWLIGARHFRGE